MLADLINLQQQLNGDSSLSESERHRRDREIAKRFPGKSRDFKGQLRHWLHSVCVDAAESKGHQAELARRLIGLVLLVLGMLTGWGAAMALFDYDGTDPVNVVNILAIFVLGQMMLLLLFAFAILPGGLLRRVPGARTLQGVIGLFNPGHLQPLLARLLAQRYREALSSALGWGKAHHTLFGRVHKWMGLLWSQQFAVAFNLGALIGCVHLIIFSDLAFGWSTTLDVEGAFFHRVVSALALPWASWFPEAVPSKELVEASKYFRFKQGVGIHTPEDLRMQAQFLGSWWSFLLACLFTYGLLPRLVTLALAWWRLRAAIDFALLHVPGAVQLLNRMNQAMVETQATEPEVRARQVHVPRPRISPQGLVGGPGYVVNWAGLAMQRDVIQDLLWQQFAVEMKALLNAGGGAALDEDQKTIARLSKTPNNQPIVLLVKSWEPPLLEFLDFVQDLRLAIGPRRILKVVPVGLADNASATPQDLDVWQNKLATLGDPWVEVQALYRA
ncbi:MAG: DUF2868 domain-containing protein [Gammaproteobacteria bacterium]